MLTFLASLIILVANGKKSRDYGGSGRGSGTGCQDSATCKWITNWQLKTCPASGLVCPNDKYCQLSCDGDFACQGRTVHAPANAELDVYCFGPNSCKDVTIKCPQGKGNKCKLWVTCNPKSNVRSSQNNPCAEGNSCPGLTIEYNTADTNYCNCVGDCLNDGGNGNRNDRCPNPSYERVLRFDGHTFKIEDDENQNGGKNNGNTSFTILAICILAAVIIVTAICVVYRQRRKKLRRNEEMINEFSDEEEEEEEIEVECDVSLTKEEGLAITQTTRV